jgi:hypothetical protein
MQTIAQQPRIQQSNEFDLLLQVSESHGFSISNDERPNRHLILYQGTPTTDYFILAVGYSMPERMDLRIIRYQKRYAQQPIGAEPDIINRLPLFVGLVDPSDETSIRAILQCTVGSLK